MDRTEKILQLRKNGLSLKKIGDLVGLSCERVRQIILNPKPKIKEFKCIFCKKIFSATDGNGVRRFCGECSKKYSCKGREFTRTLVRIRDNFTCQDCGAVRTPETAKKEGIRLFDVHHLNGLCGKRSRSYDKISEIDGLITLCHRCHFNRPEHNTKRKTLDKITIHNCS